MKAIQFPNWRVPVSLLCLGLLTACGGSGGGSTSESVVANIEAANSAPQTASVDNQSSIFIPSIGAASGTESEISTPSGGGTDLTSLIPSIISTEPNESSPGATLEEIAISQATAAETSGGQTSRSFQVFLGSDYSPEVATALPVAPTEPPEIDMFTLVTGSSALLNDLVPDGSIVATVRDTELEAVLGLAGDFEIEVPMQEP